MQRPVRGEHWAMHKPPPTRQSIDIGRAEQELRAEPAYAQDGHTARTLVRESDLRMVLIAIRQDASIDQHHTDHTACIHVLTGNITLRFATYSVAVPTGGIFVLEANAPHAVSAAVDSAFTLTIGWRDKT